MTPEALADIEPLKRLLERDETFIEIVARDHGEGTVFALEPQRRWRSPESLLLPVAQTLAKLICNEDFFACESLRGPVLHDAVRRPHARP